MKRVLAPVASDATLSQIDFPEALGVVAERCVSAPGRNRLLARRPIADVEAIRADFALVREVLDLVQDGDRFHAVPIDDLSPALDELRVERSVLDPRVLMTLGRALGAMRRLAAELTRVASDAPGLAATQVELPPPAVDARLDRSFDPDGSLRDEASPELKRARRAVRATRKKLVAALERLAPDGANVTVRNGRYVIPVTRESKAPIKGIVHDESSSGATVFVEPQSVVGLGNELQSAEAAERRAELAVLRELSDLVRTHRDAIRAGWEMCVRVDDVYARARYAMDVGATIPTLLESPAPLRIVNGRHPLLLAEVQEVVPFELDTTVADRFVLISGPNTGGKTVLLKGVGLFCALAQSGVVPPVGPRTELPVFGTIVSDIGDHQSIADSLSTYGGHLTAAREMLAMVDDGALVLIDELGTGTDPAEGAALAGALIQTLCEIGCFAMATTHLGHLKQLGADTPGVRNASLQFDPDRLEPTYRFQLGVPGRSYGLALARRLGLPATLLDRAESLRTETERSLESLLADLERRERDLDQRETAAAATGERLAAERDGLDRLKADLEAERADLDAGRKALEVEGREEARRYLLDARKRVEEALGQARGAVTAATAKEARRLVEEGVQDEATALDRLAKQAAKKGWTVRVGSSGRKPSKTGDAESAAPASRVVRRTVTMPDTDAKPEVDLRGMTGDEAEVELVRAVDDAVVEGLASLRIIHGKGTGALRERVRVVLARDRRVTGSHPASSYAGGWGVTIAEFGS